MTLFELIIVTGIFSIMSSVAIFNYGKLQAKIDIKNLANDIALKVVEAQKSSFSGKWNASFEANRKPAYGLYFDISIPTKFVYFSDLNNGGTCSDPGCVPPYSLGGEVTDVITVTRGNSLTTPGGLEVAGSGCISPVSSLTIVFKRPNTSPTITSNPAQSCAISYITVNVTSPKSLSAKIKIYASGRVQID